jgi:peptidyl-prolyl cis-trans isomerase C
VKKDAVIALIAVVLIAAASYVLASVRPDRPLTPSKPFTQTAGAKKKVDPNDRVIMHVNGEPITEAEFHTFAAQAPAESRAFYVTPEGRRLLADELVKLKTLEQEGRRLGVDADPAVRSQLSSISSQIVAGKTLEKLVKEGLDQKIQAEFAKEKAGTKTLRHILIAYRGSQVPPKAGEAPSAEQATQKAAAIVARLRAGADFAEAARAESDDQQTAANGGVLGAARPEQLPPNIAAVVNTLRPGQVSDPVRTEFGIHLFRVDEPSLEEMRPMLEQRLQRDVMTQTVERLQKAAKVDLDKAFFPEPKTPSPAPAAPAPKSNG